MRGVRCLNRTDGSFYVSFMRALSNRSTVASVKPPSSPLLGRGEVGLRSAAVQADGWSSGWPRLAGTDPDSYAAV
jgi:hypothetical protein